MAKFSMFLSFILFVLIAMPTSSSSRMTLEEVEAENKCPKPDCSLVKCEPFFCIPIFLDCPNGRYSPCCSCPECCPA
ncbi:hypothetical protein MKX01_039841 [Papaver californicum]|nr:hypothetical protein MKX01_039841 [Papaver californicum]